MDCSDELYPFPQEIGDKTREDDITEEEWEMLTCPKCGDLLRPHVLWFDEYYNEEYYKYDSSINAARDSDMLFVIGTSGATNLPNTIVNFALVSDTTIVEINIDDNRFTDIIATHENGLVIREKSGVVLPKIVQLFKQHLSN